MVEWEDAFFREVLLTPEQCKTGDGYRCRSVGWLVHRDKKDIRIAMNQINNGQVRDLLVVPMALVKRVKRLR